jgi:metallophosphoesterase (TIGR00282 family)
VKLLFLGDVVGRSGRKAIAALLPGLIAKHSFDFVIVNGENAAGGFGITEEILQELLAAGADCVTTGNHVWDQREALVFADRYDRFLRPINYPPGTAGRGANVYAARNGARVLVVNVMGTLFMPALDDPFQAVTRELNACALGNGCDAVVIDMHAEASSEKQTMGYFLDGKASLVIGTHTHVPTADWKILPGGTAYMTDVGMCGDYDSIIGMEKDEPLRRATTKIASGRLVPALRAGALSGLAVDIDDKTGLARQVAPLRLGPGLSSAEPDFGEAP